jgi:16S rRNA (guanine527-N7)-methyltransferase
VPEADWSASFPARVALREVLEDAQRQGFIGSGPLVPHLEHSLGFASALEQARGSALSVEDRIVDLGPGGGLPGLVLATWWPAVAICLVEGSSRRASFLEAAVEHCGFRGRVEVVGMRAELAGREARLRGGHTVVVARLFGSPSETAECASPLLGIGGHLVVSEPPGRSGSARWAQGGLDILGLVRLAGPTEGPSFAVFRQDRACPEGFPRRVGVPGKRRLFSA